MLTPKPTTGESSWFTADRFGMFVHWGLYALPARHEGNATVSFPELVVGRTVRVTL